MGGGAFVGVDKVINERVSKTSIGFGANVKRDGHEGSMSVGDAVEASSKVTQNVEHMDMINYGLIPEFVGRFPVLAILKQMASMIAHNNATLYVSDDAISVIAKQAYERATGARGLRSIFEGLFRDALYEVPNRSRESEEEVVVFLHHHQGSAAVEVVVGMGNIETFMNN